MNKLTSPVLQPFEAVGGYTYSLSELLNGSLEAAILRGDLDVRDSVSERFREAKNESLQDGLTWVAIGSCERICEFEGITREEDWDRFCFKLLVGDGDG